MSLRNTLSRRKLLQHGATLGAGVLGASSAAHVLSVVRRPGPTLSLPPGPIAIASANGPNAVAKAVSLMKAGVDPTEAAVEGVVIVELDPNDMSVGYGGLPNEQGVVELDACVMHGPTMRAGAVAAIQNIKTPSRVALQVMRRTDHVLLVGAGALQFAKAVGFTEENILTDRAREAWLRWKAGQSKDDDWLSPDETNADFPGPPTPDGVLAKRPTGTISCLCLNDKGELGGCTTTSGLAFKLPGRVGDSPIIGAGLYVDGEVGAAGSTGRGEANIQVCGGRTVVENMKDGMSPEEAILDVLRRVCDQTKSPRLLIKAGRPNFDLNFYALRKDGAFASGAIYRGATAVIATAEGTKQLNSAWLHERM